MGNKVYYNEINVARAIGIIMVVLFHSSGPNTYILNYVKDICNTIQMPLFFFLSGFVAFKIRNINSKEEYFILIKSKFKRLLGPYLFLGVLLFLPKLLMNKYAVVKIDPNSFLYDLLVLGNNPITFLWFLYVLFMIFVIYSNLIRKSSLITFFINLILYIAMKKYNINIQIFRISTIIHYANYFILGFISFKYYDYIKAKYEKTIGIISISLLLSFLLLLKINIYGISFIHILIVFTGINGVLAASIYLSKSRFEKILVDIGNYSYDIYLLSWFGQNIVRILAQIVGISLNSWIVFVGMFVGGISVMFISKYIFRKNRITNNYILGNTI